MLIPPDLNRLRVFFHVYVASGVAAAARELHVTPSAVSQALGRLEAEIDTQLFVRVHRGLVPTPAAHTLFGVVSPFLEQLRAGVEGLQRARDELVGTLRIGAPAQLGAHRLPPLLSAFRARHARVRFELELGHPASTLPMLERGELDLVLADVFAGPEPQQVGVAVETLMDERLIMVGSDETVARLGPCDNVEALLAVSYVAYRPRAPALRSWFSHHFGRAALPLDIALTVESVQAVVSAIEHHMGLGVVPSHLVDRQLDGGRLVEVHTGREPLTHRVALVRLLDRVPTALERAVARELQRQLGGRT